MHKELPRHHELETGVDTVDTTDMEPHDLEDVMASRRTVLSSLATGRGGIEMMMKDVRRSMRSSDIGAVGMHDPLRSRRGYLVGAGCEDGSLTRAEFEKARDYANIVDRGMGQVLEKLAHRQAMRGRRVGKHFHFHPLVDSSPSSTTGEGIAAFGRRLPDYRTVVATEVGEFMDRNERTLAGYNRVASWYDTRNIVACIISDVRGPLSRRHDPEAQHNHLVVAHASFLTGDVMEFWDVPDERPELSGFWSWRCASRQLAPHWLWWPMRVAREADVASQTIQAIQAVLDLPETATIETTIATPPDLPTPLVISVPYWRWDWRWAALIRDVEQYIQRRTEHGGPFRKITPVYIAGNGAPDPEHRGARWRVQASLLVPLMGEPTAISELRQGAPEPPDFTTLSRPATPNGQLHGGHASDLTGAPVAALPDGHGVGADGGAVELNR